MLTILLACTPSATPDSDPATDDSVASIPDNCDLQPTGEVSLPADEAPHGEDVEWWYWTAHVQDEEGRWYGIEETFFLMQMGTYTATSAHVAVADISAGTFTYDVNFVMEGQESTTDGFDLVSEQQTATGSDGQETLHGEIDGYTLDLELSASKPPVFQHGDGYHDYEVGGYTWYYSRERIDTTGTLLVGEESRAVEGLAWMDHQWGDLGDISTSGWDWFALQLDDGSEVMLFLTRGSDTLVGGSFTDSGCNTTELGPEDFQVEALGEWTSPATDCTYPQGWRLEVLGKDLTVTPELADQEVDNVMNTYWEGASVVSGDLSGRAAARARA